MNDTDIRRHVDEWGQVWFNGDDAAELLLRGHDITTLLFEPSAEVDRYNEWCDKFAKPTHRLNQPLTGNMAADALKRLDTWWIAEPYRDLDVRETLLTRCVTEPERQRVHQEMDLFKARNLLPVLRLMCMLVDHFRRHDIVWGVGRGSSVASYVLFLIGIHRIDSLGYGLDIREFLKPSIVNNQ